MKRTPPPFKPDELTPEQLAFLAWVNATDERGNPRYGITAMPARGMSMATDLFYDIIRSARLAYMLAGTLEDVSEAKRRDAEERLAEMASPVGSAQRMVQAFENVKPGVKIEILRNTHGFVVQGYAHGATISKAIDNWLIDPRTRRKMK